MSPKNLFLALTMFLTVLTVSVSAQPVTHMGVGPLEQVTLEASCPLSQLCNITFKRSLPDGTTEKGFFVIPERHVLVVTDVDWNLHGKSNFDWFLAGQDVKVSLNRVNDSIQASNTPFRSTATLTTTSFCEPFTDCEEEISAGSNTQMTSGFVVTTGAKFTWSLQAENLDFLKDPEFQVKVRGYLLPIE